LALFSDHKSFRRSKIDYEDEFEDEDDYGFHCEEGAPLCWV
jgi:hypothetical protein